MACDFMPFSTVIQSYQDDGQVKMTIEKISASGRALTRSATSVGQGLNFGAVGVPI